MGINNRHPITIVVMYPKLFQNQIGVSIVLTIVSELLYYLNHIYWK